MSFSTNIKTLIESVPNINTLVTGGIYYEHLPDNFDKEKVFIVYSFNVASNEQCLTGTSLFLRYNVYVKVVTQDTYVLETISDTIRNYLNGNDYQGIIDVSFVSDDHTMNLEEQIYMNTLQFITIY